MCHTAIRGMQTEYDLHQRLCKYYARSLPLMWLSRPPPKGTEWRVHCVCLKLIVTRAIVVCQLAANRALFHAGRAGAVPLLMQLWDAWIGDEQIRQLIIFALASIRCSIAQMHASATACRKLVMQILQALEQISISLYHFASSTQMSAHSP